MDKTHLVRWGRMITNDSYRYTPTGVLPMNVMEILLLISPVEYNPKKFSTSDLDIMTEILLLTQDKSNEDLDRLRQDEVFHYYHALTPREELVEPLLIAKLHGATPEMLEYIHEHLSLQNFLDSL
jgi:hypothetical protein